MPSDAAMRLLLEISKEVHAKVSNDYVHSMAPEKRAYVEELKSAGYLERCDEYSHHDTGSVVRVMPGYCSLCVSDAGWAALSARQEQLDQLRDEAKRKTCGQARDDAGRLAEKVAEKRRSWWQFWLGLFLGWILGGFTPQEVWRWIKTLPPFG